MIIDFENVHRINLATIAAYNRSPRTIPVVRRSFGQGWGEPPRGEAETEAQHHRQRPRGRREARRVQAA
jgi:hypothetical protein